MSTYYNNVFCSSGAMGGRLSGGVRHHGPAQLPARRRDPGRPAQAAAGGGPARPAG